VEGHARGNVAHHGAAARGMKVLKRKGALESTPYSDRCGSNTIKQCPTQQCTDFDSKLSLDEPELAILAYTLEVL
jgi:hypothetical protein